LADLSRRSGRSSIGALALALGIAATCIAASVVWGERSEVGNLIVSLDARVSPHTLPRKTYVPAALLLHTTFRTTDRSLIPRLEGLTIDLNRRGKLFNKGLPSCRLRELEPSSPRRAIALCGHSLVGQGRLHATVSLPEQSPFRIRARLLAFNGKAQKGQGTVLVLVYGASPQIAFVLPFVIHRSGFDLGTKLTTKVPKDAGTWAHVGGFTLVVKRLFSYRGKPRSYINADCPVPRGFTAGITPFARAIYHFAGTATVTTVLARGCRVAGG
jgi:hypothetical protein